MRNLLVCGLPLAALTLGGCFGEDYSDPVTDTLARTPLMYKPDIQQGNVVTQDQVNKLEPGMERRQVRFIMGTPLLVDTFHQDRWDYFYSLKKGGHEAERKRISLYFKDDRLTGIEGDLRPDPGAPAEQQHAVVSVPDHKRNKGIIGGAMSAVGLGDKETPRVEKKDAPKEEDKTEVKKEAISAESVEDELEKAATEAPASDKTATPAK